MFCKVLKAKIHGATVTQTEVAYVGSITLDEDLLRASGIRPNEVVLVADLDNGQRFETYVVKGPAGSGTVAVNGAAARLVESGHRVIIFSHLFLDPEDFDEHEARVVVLDEQNRVAETFTYPSRMEEPAAR